MHVTVSVDTVRSLAARSMTHGTEDDVQDTLEMMRDRLRDMPHLQRLGLLFCETVLIDIDGEEYYLTFRDGMVTAIARGPSRKTPWRFALRTDAAALAAFWQPVPQPGFHDIFALAKIGRARIDGDILTLVKNLRFFKEFMALGREITSP
jgi:hypothetical protein